MYIFELDILPFDTWQFCLVKWIAHAPWNRDDGGLLPDAYLHLINR